MIEHVQCNLCGESSTELVFEITENITGSNEKFNLVRCKSCGLQYVNPRPSKDSIGRYYPDDSYYSYQFRNPDSLKQRIRNIVLEERGKHPRTGKNNPILNAIGKLIAKSMKGQGLMTIPFHPNGIALDIGCGCGEQLLWLKNHGWGEVHGVEISKTAAELANKNGLNVFCGEIAGARYPDQYFDAVTISQVLEHVHDPMMTLKEIYRVLKPDGFLIIGVPNIDSYENRIFSKYHSLMDIPRHLYHFNHKTISNMLDKAGFKIDSVTGKTFFIPKANMQSLRMLAKDESFFRTIAAGLRIYVEKPVRYFFADNKDDFGQLFTFYIKRKYVFADLSKKPLKEQYCETI